ncbi:hypothetical protein [Mycolicibacterium sp. 624]|uniref:hypothetical protein n=1 Tax=Mycolicibacterium sp. 624 TaxID=3156314 RepID=UPI0033951AD1
MSVALPAALWHLGDLVLLAIAAIASVGWQVTCVRAECTGRHQATPLVIIGTAVAVLILLSGWAIRCRRPRRALDVTVRPGHLTGPRADGARRAPGATRDGQPGGATGPRLGGRGQLTMASAVVAAKSIIRFPEISAKRDRDGNAERVGIDDVTEYFLVGSLASWILAFGSLALVGLSGL